MFPGRGVGENARPWRPSNRRLGKLQLALLGRHPILEANSTSIGRPPKRRPSPGPQSWKADSQSVRLNLEKHLGIGKTGQAMAAETVEPDAGRRRCPNRGPGGGGHDDLSSVGRRAKASGGVDGETDVPDVRQGGAA